MLADYEVERYLVLPILAKLPRCCRQRQRRSRIGQSARRTKRQRCHCYGGGAGLLVHKLGVTRAQGHRLHDLHHDRYDGYWQWSDRKIQRVYDDGSLVALDGRRGFRGADRRPGKAVHVDAWTQDAARFAHRDHRVGGAIRLLSSLRRSG